jgi:hypothetical protein
MDGQRQRSGGGRRRRRKNRSENRAAAEPILIVARRPNSPLIVTSERGAATAIAPPRRNRSHGPASAPRQPPAPREDHGGGADVESLDADKPAETPAHAEGTNGTNGRRERSARIVQVTRGDADGRERERLRLMDRLMGSETRGAITRAANEYASAGFEFPAEQSVQLQLLEHFDEDSARDAIEVLKGLLESEAPLKRPIMEQRLRRLEEYAEEPATRAAAAELRRAIRA